MVDVPWPTTTSPGNAPGEGAGRLINCYASTDGGAPRWKPLPGIDPFGPGLLDGPVRGFFVNNSLALAVTETSVAQIAGDGSFELLEGSVSGDSPVTIARNNNLIPTTCIVSETGAYVISPNGVIQGYPDGNLPTPNSVAFLDGYLLFTTAGGTIWASARNDTTIDPDSNARAEAYPDGLLRGIAFGQQYFAFGPSSIEVWQDAGTSPFPLSRSTVIKIGLYGQWAIAGDQPGWGGPLIFVADDGSVRSLDGYTPTRISSEDLERLIEQVPGASLRASVYTFGGNLIWSLSSPTWTWEYNVTTGNWHERQSYGGGRWRAGQTVKSFGKWIASDALSGALYTIDPDVRADGSAAFVWGLDSGPVKQFPSRIAVPVCAFDFVLGQAALGQTADCMISWSHDGGGRWSNPVVRSLQSQGRFAGRVSINRVGLTTHHGVRWRFRVSDPAYTSFSGARMDAVDRK